MLSRSWKGRKANDQLPMSHKCCMPRNACIQGLVTKCSNTSPKQGSSRGESINCAETMMQLHTHLRLLCFIQVMPSKEDLAALAERNFRGTRQRSLVSVQQMVERLATAGYRQPPGRSVLVKAHPTHSTFSGRGGLAHSNMRTMLTCHILQWRCQDDWLCKVQNGWD